MCAPVSPWDDPCVLYCTIKRLHNNALEPLLQLCYNESEYFSSTDLGKSRLISPVLHSGWQNRYHALAKFFEYV